MQAVARMDPRRRSAPRQARDALDDFPEENRPVGAPSTGKHRCAPLVRPRGVEASGSPRQEAGQGSESSLGAEEIAPTENRKGWRRPLGWLRRLQSIRVIPGGTLGVAIRRTARKVVIVDGVRRSPVRRSARLDLSGRAGPTRVSGFSPAPSSIGEVDGRARQLCGLRRPTPQHTASSQLIAGFVPCRRSRCTGCLGLKPSRRPGTRSRRVPRPRDCRQHRVDESISALECRPHAHFAGWRAPRYLPAKLSARFCRAPGRLRATCRHRRRAHRSSLWPQHGRDGRALARSTGSREAGRVRGARISAPSPPSGPSPEEMVPVSPPSALHAADRGPRRNQTMEALATQTLLTVTTAR
jgi:hypothetical protein